MAVPVDAVAAHRLVLTAAEFAVLIDTSGVRPPAGFSASRITMEESAMATLALVDRGVLVESGDPPGYEPVESVAANLAVLTGSVVTVQVEVSAGGRGLRSVFGVSGPLGASLFTLADGAMELSMFPATALGVELIRAVPAPDKLGNVRPRLYTVLRGGDHDHVPLAGRLPLAALETSSEYISTTNTPTELTAEQAALAERIIGDELAVGQVVWFATDAGWLGLRPDPLPDGTRMVVLEPVDRADLGIWIAPYVAEILDASG
jgi:hypothetical protein